MTNQEAVKVIADTLDAGTQKGLYGNLVTAKGVFDAFTQLVTSLQAYEQQAKMDAVRIGELGAEVDKWTNRSQYQK
jgi:hypothetical protein